MAQTLQKLIKQAANLTEPHYCTMQHLIPAARGKHLGRWCITIDRQRFGSWSWIINVHRWGIKEAGEIMVGVCGIPWHLSGVSPHSCVQGRTHTLHLPPHIMLLDQSKVFLDNGINSFSNLFYQLTIDNCNAIWNIMTYIHGSIKYQLYIYRLLPH